MAKNLLFVRIMALATLAAAGLARTSWVADGLVSEAHAEEQTQAAEPRIEQPALTLSDDGGPLDQTELADDGY